MLFSIFLIFFFVAKVVFGQSSYIINNFNSAIKIEKTGEVKIAETIDVDFLNIEKHGIFRDIPYIYEDENGNKTYSKVEVVQVLQDGRVATVKKSNNGSFLNLRIGDADKEISGKHKYVIMYTASGVLASFENYDELYWNITGNGWDAPIASTTAIITTSQDAIISGDCYEGMYLSEEICGNQIENSSNVKFWTTRKLLAGEGMTVVAGLEKGVFPIITVERPKTFFENLFSPPSIFIFFITLFSGILFLIKLWNKYGRDSWYRGISGMMGKKATEEVKPIGAHEPVVVEYAPPEKLPPAIVGVLADERADTLDITATIIDLASRGFLKITEIPKSWIFGKVDYLLSEISKDRSKLFGYEKELLTRLFSKNEIKTSELKTTFYDDLAKVKEKLYEELISKKYFPHNPNNERNKYLIIGFLMIFAGIFTGVFAASSEIAIFTSFGIAIAILGIITLVISRFMSKRTAVGRELFRRIKGYRLFIDQAESYKQKFFENKNIFTEVLPYAIVFGLTEKFAKAMKDIGLKPQNPSWYTGVHAFSLTNFSSSVNDFSSSMSTAIASTPSSSGGGGGGSSGGGFGGGGGGSW